MELVAMFGEGSGDLVHAGVGGYAISLCGVLAAPGTLERPPEEKPITCPACLAAPFPCPGCGASNWKADYLEAVWQGVVLTVAPDGSPNAVDYDGVTGSYDDGSTTNEAYVCQECEDQVVLGRHVFQPDARFGKRGDDLLRLETNDGTLVFRIGEGGAFEWGEGVSPDAAAAAFAEEVGRTLGLLLPTKEEREREENARPIA